MAGSRNTMLAASTRVPAFATAPRPAVYRGRPATRVSGWHGCSSSSCREPAQQLLQQQRRRHVCRESAGAGAAASQVPAGAAAPHPTAHTTYLHRSMAKNEHLVCDGSVIIRGHVGPDACIEAGGDVMVWGRLAGHVHAGARGDTSATISALELRGAQLVIANVSSLAAAKITVPGPHVASVASAGRKYSMQLAPLGATHPPAAPAGLARSLAKWLTWYPAAAAALFTGAYALLGGAALLVAPKTLLGMLADCSTVSAGWIRLGGVLFACFGAQYAGAALLDYHQAVGSGSSSSGLPFMPFRPGTPENLPDQQAGGRDDSSSSSSSSSSSANAHAQHRDMQQQQQQRMEHATHASSCSQQPHPGVAAAAAAISRPSSVAAGDGQGHGGMSSASVDLMGSVWERLDSGHNGGGGSGHKQQAPPPPLTAAALHSMDDQGGAHAAAHDAVAGGAAGARVASSWLCSSNGFYAASVWARFALAAAFCCLVAAGQVSPGLLVLAALNALGALTMLNALQRQWTIHVLGELPSTAATTWA